MPENWKTYKLEDVTTRVTVGFVGSMAQEYVEDGIPMLRSQNIKPFCLDYGNLKYISPKFHEKIRKSRLKKDDVAIVRTGNPGTACVIPEGIPELNCSDLVIATPDKSKIDPHFLSFYFNSIARNYISSELVGAVQQHFNVGSAKKMEIKIPKIEEQHKIVSILKAIQDKIELNLQMNKTLEEMAMALYKQWFVDFGPFQDGEFVDSKLGEIPKGWEVKKMEDIISVKDGTHDSPKRTEEGYHLITSKHIKTNEIDFSTSYKISEKDYHKINQRSKVDKDDILMTMIGTVGLFHLVNNEPNYAIKNIGLFKTSEKKEMKNFLFLFFNSQYSTHYIQSQLAGSTQQYLTLKVLRAFPVLQPPEKELLNFNIQIEEFLKLIEWNICENQTLTQLRDTLLSKLISGEVRVKDVEKTLSQVL